MSSLAATQADGYYLPPSYFSSGAYKKKSKNEFAGSKGHNQFVAKVSENEALYVYNLMDVA